MVKSFDTLPYMYFNILISSGTQIHRWKVLKAEMNNDINEEKTFIKDLPDHLPRHITVRIDGSNTIGHSSTTKTYQVCSICKLSFFCNCNWKSTNICAYSENQSEN